jgi:hypothetical protein
MSVLVWIEQNNGGPVGNSFEVLARLKTWPARSVRRRWLC